MDNVITVNGIEYIKKDEKPEQDGEYFIVRTYSAGVFFGKIKSLDRALRTAILTDARRVWYWAGAASLSQLAADGTSKPEECKFPCALDNHEVFQVEEILPMTKKALKSLQGVPVWKQ